MRLLGDIDCDLVGVADPSEEARKFAADTHGLQTFADYRELDGKVDAVSVVVPTKMHREVGCYFLERGVDVLVITHGDADHHNGLARLLETSRVARGVVPAVMAETAVHQLLRQHADQVDLLRPGERLCVDQLIVYAPNVPRAASANDQSLWVRADVGDAEVLLCGDAQELGVAAALADGIAAPADVLLLPHHGRTNHNLPQLLARVRPRAVSFISSMRALAASNSASRGAMS